MWAHVWPCPVFANRNTRFAQKLGCTSITFHSHCRTLRFLCLVQDLEIDSLRARVSATLEKKDKAILELRKQLAQSQASLVATEKALAYQNTELQYLWLFKTVEWFCCVFHHLCSWVWGTRSSHLTKFIEILSQNHIPLCKAGGTCRCLALYVLEDFVSGVACMKDGILGSFGSNTIWLPYIRKCEQIEDPCLLQERVMVRSPCG